MSMAPMLLPGTSASLAMAPTMSAGRMPALLPEAR
jgi:hypothetical protein